MFLINWPPSGITREVFLINWPSSASTLCVSDNVATNWKYKVFVFNPDLDLRSKGQWQACGGASPVSSGSHNGVFESQSGAGSRG